MLTLDVFQAGSFATQAAQVIKLGAADFGRTDEINFIDYPRALGEDALHSLAEADLTHGEAGLRPMAARDHYAFKRLQAFFIAFFDFYLDTHRVSGAKLWQVGALGFCKNFFDYQVGHGLPRPINSDV